VLPIQLFNLSSVKTKAHLELICQIFHFVYRIQQITLFRMVLKRLKLPQFFNGVARTFPPHKRGCQKRGKNLEISAKKAVFLVSSVKKQISPLLAPPLEKRFEKSTSGSPGKISSDAHAHKHVKFHQLIVLHHLATLFNNTNAVGLNNP